MVALAEKLLASAEIINSVVMLDTVILDKKWSGEVIYLKVPPEEVAIGVLYVK